MLGGQCSLAGLPRGDTDPQRGGGKPSCPSPSAGDLRELLRVPLRGEGSCGGPGPRGPGR